MVWTSELDPGYIRRISVYAFGTGWALLVYLRHSRGLRFPSPPVPKKCTSRLVSPLQALPSVLMFETTLACPPVHPEACSQAKVTTLCLGY